MKIVRILEEFFEPKRVMFTVLKERKKKRKEKASPIGIFLKRKTQKLYENSFSFLGEGAFNCSRIFLFLPGGGRSWNLTSATSEGSVCLGPQ
jgi:hypothetical protein